MQLVFLKAIAVASTAIGAHAGRVQLPGLTVPSSAAANRDSVVRIFNDSYNDYRCAWNFRTLSMGLSLGRVVIENLLLATMRWRQQATDPWTLEMDGVRLL
jgi:hypothetical protein